MGNNYQYTAGIILFIGLLVAVFLFFAQKTVIGVALAGSSIAIFVTLYSIGAILCHQEEQIELLKKLLGENKNGEQQQSTEENK